MKKIEDYLHLYLGCDYRVESHWVEGKAGTIMKRMSAAQLSDHERGHVVIKPILRPLASLTEEEAIEMYNYLFPKAGIIEDSFKANIIRNHVSQEGSYYEGKTSIHDYTYWFPYLLSKGFDLFNLIPEGLALSQDMKSKNETV